jgi:hypothetical protein
VVAWPHEGIVPIELWDVRVDGKTLFDRRGEPTFYVSLARAVRALHRGEAVRGGGDPLAASPWTVVSMVGGALDEARARDAFDAAGIALDVLSDDAFFATSHALEALGEDGALRGDAVVIDVGQTAIKASGPGGRIRRQRLVTSEFSTTIDTSGGPEGERGAFADEIAAALADACPGRAPSFVLLGLPCEVERRGGDVLLGHSTYPTAGDGTELMRAVLRGAGCGATPAALVNDAVLAAWALARRSPCRAAFQLVLTLGLGVGAALIDRKAADPVPGESGVA